MSLSDDILDAMTRHGVYVERYKAQLARQILGLVREVEGKIAAEVLRKEIDGLSRRELARMLARVKDAIDNGYEPVTKAIESELDQFAAYEAEWQLEMLRRTVPVDLDWRTPSPEQLYAAAKARPFQGRLLREWYQGLPDGQFRRVRAVIRQGYVEGKTTDQIVREIRGTRTTVGIIEQSRRGAQAAVRTAVAHTANVARNEVYRANSKLLKGVEWVSTLDSRTSPICRAYDGQLFPLDSGPRPPAHVACRSSTIPVVKSAAALGLKNIPKSTRASMNGQVSGELNYDQWLRRQNTDLQNEILGPSRAKLFREGVTMDKFVDRAGNEITLDQLRVRESAAWSNSGL